MKSLVLAALVALLGGCSGLVSAGTKTIADFEDGVDGFASEAAGTRLSVARSPGILGGKQALRLQLPPGPYPGVYKDLGGADWSGLDVLALDVHNPTKRALVLYLRVDDVKSKGYSTRFNLSPGVDLPPGATTVEIPLALMARASSESRGIDLSQVKAVFFFLNKQTEPVELWIDNVRLLERPDAPPAKKRLLAAAGRETAFHAEEAAVLAVRDGDWSAFDRLCFSIRNDTQERISVALRIDDQSSKGYATRFNLEGLTVGPGRNDYEVPLAHLTHGSSASRGIDLARIKQAIVFVAGEQKTAIPLKLIDPRLEAAETPGKTKEILDPADERTWSPNGTTEVKKTATGISWSASGAPGYPGIRLPKVGGLYGYDLIEMDYEASGTEWHTLHIKLTSRDGQRVNLITGVKGKGTIRLPVAVAATIPLGDIAEMTLFFEPDGCPESFGLTAARAVPLPRGAGEKAPSAGTTLTLDCAAITGMRNTAFLAWVAVPQAGGGYRTATVTTTDRKRTSFAVDAAALRGADLGGERKALVGVYFSDHGNWNFSVREVALISGKSNRVPFSIPEVGRR